MIQRYVLDIGSTTGLDLSKRLLPEYLRDLGYSTHLVGKWHLGHCNRAYLPVSRGFDTQYGFATGCQEYWNRTYPFYPFLYDYFEDDVLLKNERVETAFGLVSWGQILYITWGIMFFVSPRSRNFYISSSVSIKKAFLTYVKL